MGKDIPKLYMEIRQLIVKTVISVQPQLSHIYHSCQPKEYQNEMCFEVLGFDVMIDEKMRPWLLEVNHSASFHCDSPLDSSIKKNVILDTLNILNVSSKEKKSYLEMKSQAQFAYRKKEQTKLEAEQEKKKIDPQKIIRYENKHKGAFIRIYPADDDPTEYQKILQISHQVWNETIAPKKNIIFQNQQNNPTTSKKDQKNIMTTPAKKPLNKDSTAILNSTQSIQLRSESKSKVLNSPIKNISQIQDSQEQNEIINLEGQRDLNNSQLLDKQDLIDAYIPRSSQTNIRNETAQSNESQSIQNNNSQEGIQIFINEKDDKQEILYNNTKSKQRSITLNEKSKKTKQDLYDYQLFHAPSFLKPSSQQKTEIISLEASNQIIDNTNILDLSQEDKYGQQNIIKSSMLNSYQIPQQLNQQNQIKGSNSNFKTNNNFHFVDNFKENQVQQRINVNSSFSEQEQNFMQSSAITYQQASLDQQRKLNVINLGINSPELFMNESFCQQSQKPLYLRSYIRKHNKGQLKPLSQDFQILMLRNMRNNNINKVQNQNIQNDAILSIAPKYQPLSKVNIPNRYTNNSYSQNTENLKQAEYTVYDQFIQRNKNNSMPSKTWRSELYQPQINNINNRTNSIHQNQINDANQQNKTPNLPVVQQLSNQMNNSSINQNTSFNNNDMSINSINTQISFHQNNNIRNNLQGEIQIPYSNRRAISKSVERKQIKGMNINDRQVKDRIQQHQKQLGIQIAQIQNTSVQLRSTQSQMNPQTQLSSLNFNNMNNNSCQSIDDYQIGTYDIDMDKNNKIQQQGTIYNLKQKKKENQDLMNFINQDQPLLIQQNMFVQQSSQQKNTNNSNIYKQNNSVNSNTYNINNNGVIIDNTLNSKNKYNNSSESKIYTRNQFISNKSVKSQQNQNPSN